MIDKMIKKTWKITMRVYHDSPDSFPAPMLSIAEERAEAHVIEQIYKYGQSKGSEDCVFDGMVFRVVWRKTDDCR